MQDKIKAHFKEHKNVYMACVVTAGITALIVRDIIPRHISHDTIVTAGRDTIVTRANVVNNISYVFNNRQGPPSWVVRCLETGMEYSSQRAAALAMGLPASRLSQHLNGFTDHVGGYHFERICLAI